MEHQDQNNKDAETSPRIMISGGFFTKIDYNNFSQITPEDIAAIAEDWENTVPEEYKDLLNAE